MFTNSIILDERIKKKGIVFENQNIFNKFFNKFN
jgi:hypothetical protein